LPRETNEEDQTKERKKKGGRRGNLRSKTTGRSKIRKLWSSCLGGGSGGDHLTRGVGEEREVRKGRFRWE